MTPSLSSRVQVFVGDITHVDADAIVTAANQALRGGGGVDGAVHAAAGPQLVSASMACAPCPAGNAVITPGFRLQADYVIHAVGPVFRDLEKDSMTLASAYRSALSLAAEHSVARIAFPCISTGVYGFPRRPACEVATTAVLDWLKTNKQPQVVIFCCFDPSDAVIYNEQLSNLGMTPIE